MSNVYPNELRYTSTHEWVRTNADNTITVGITDHAQHQLGDLVFVELPKVHKQITGGAEAAVVESVKTAADVYSPVSGTVIAVNETLQQTPGTVNSDPYGEGWIFRLKVIDDSALAKLLDAEKYQSLIESQL
jgi:glycine cleavage system H protein